MWRIGFGLERLGLLALRFPKFFTVFLVILTLFCSVSVLRLNFDGNVIAVLPDESVAYRQYVQMQEDYRNFSRDVTILVESDRLKTARGLDEFRNLQLEVSLADGVANATSILSIPDFDPDTGELVDWFPLEFTDDAQVVRLVDDLIVKYPQARSLFSTEHKIAVIIVSLDVSIQDDDTKSIETYLRVKQDAQAFAPTDFKLAFTGLTPVGATIISSLISDQLRLTIIGLILGAGIGFYVFRSVPAAVICACPPAFTAIWSLGLFSFLGVPVNFLTTVLPTLALILAFADGIFLYYRWQTSNVENQDLSRNLADAIKRVGPASSLTSLTTAIAFLSFLYASSNALKEFAFIGAGVVSLAFIAVIVGLPIILYWAIRFNLIKPGKSRKPVFQSLGRRIRGAPLGHPFTISVAGIFLLVAFGFVHQWIRPEYNITDYLPTDSDVYDSEKLANKVIGGRSLLLVSVPLSKEGGFENADNRSRLANVEKIVAGRFDVARIFSANGIFSSVESETAKNRIGELANDAGNGERAGFLSKDGKSTLITVRLASDLSVEKIAADVNYLKAAFNALGLEKEIVVSGFPVLMSIEFSNLIEQLRTSLLIAICLGIVVVGVATRSPFITIAAITPNLLPIFFVQFILFLRGGTINLSEVIALTIAFGIAIDNAVHLINVYDAQKRDGKDVRHALSSALEEVGPALAAGSVIICASALVTQISILPLVPIIGQLIIVTLIAALLANLFILPANILTLEQLRQWWSNRNIN